MRRLATLTLLISLTAACGSSSTESDGSDDPAKPVVPPEEEPLSLSINVDAVPPGVENTQCMRVRLGNAGPIDVGRMVNTISSSSHHFVVSTVNEEDAGPEELVPFDCAPFRAPLTGFPLMITQAKRDEMQLPDGVGFKFVDDQMIHLELHYINTTTEPVDIVAQADFYPIAEGTTVEEAGVLLVGSLDIDIPPLADHTLGPLYQAVPEEYLDVDFYAMTGHTHQYGTDVTVGTAAGEGMPMDPKYAPDEFVWDEPEIVFFDPPFRVPQDGGFSFSCSWRNTTSEVLSFGESANEEMCFFWTYYFPRKQARPVLLHDFGTN